MAYLHATCHLPPCRRAVGVLKKLKHLAVSRFFANFADVWNKLTPSSRYSSGLPPCKTSHSSGCSCWKNWTKLV